MAKANPVRVAVVALLLVAWACAGSDGSEQSLTEAAPTPSATPLPAPSPTEPPAAESPEPTVTPEPTATPELGIDPHLLAVEVQDIVERARGARSGGIIAVLSVDGEQVAVAVGAADETARALEPDTPMRVGSVSKMFTATMVLQLVEEGLLSLDDPLSNHLGDLPIGADATVREVLSHRAGLANYTDSFRFAARVARGLEGESTDVSADEVLGWAAQLDSPPRGTFAYSNTGYTLLGLLIEAVDGRPLNDALEARITGPLGLSVTRFAFAGREDPEGLAAPFSRLAGLDGPVDLDYGRAFTGWSDGSLISTADELAVFLRALFDGDLVSEATVADMTGAAGIGARGLESYGLGIFAAPLARGPWWGHNGANVGFLAVAMIQPESGDVIIVLSNDDSMPGGASDELAELRDDLLRGDR